MTDKEFSEKIKAGLKIAERRMIEEKALRGEDIIVSSDGKTIERIPAKQLLVIIMGTMVPDPIAPTTPNYSLEIID